MSSFGNINVLTSFLLGKLRPQIITSDFKSTLWQHSKTTSNFNNIKKKLKFQLELNFYFELLLVKMLQKFHEMYRLIYISGLQDNPLGSNKCSCI